jgi:hypothetical protein
MITSPLHLRPAEPADIAQILSFIRELADYERAPEKAVATPADIQRHVFGEHPLAFVVMADWDGAPAGFALWFYNFSTWEGRPEGRGFADPASASGVVDQARRSSSPIWTRARGLSGGA